MQIRHRLTRGYARTIDFSGVSRDEIYNTHGEEHRVYWVDAERWPMAGQCTLFGTILLNEARLDGMPEEVVDYVFLHEVGHTKPPFVLTLGSLFLRIPLMFFVVFGIPLLLVRWLVFAFSGPDVGQLVTFSVGTALAGLLILVPLIVISWLDEGHAELFAISKIGSRGYQRCLEKKREHSSRGMVMRILSPLLYPPPKLVLHVANRRYQ